MSTAENENRSPERVSFFDSGHLPSGPSREWKDPDFYGRDAEYPGELVRLGTRGRLRDQYFVELMVTPFRWNPVTGAARVAEEVEILITFEEDSPSPPQDRKPVRKGSREESWYRGKFLNHYLAELFG